MTSTQTQQLVQWIVEALTALLQCCNPCPNTDCRQTWYLDNGTGTNHLPIPFAEYEWSPDVSGATVRDAWLQITEIDFPVDTVLGVSNIGKYGRFYWLYRDETGTQVKGETIYLDKLRQLLDYPVHPSQCDPTFDLHSWAPTGFGYVLSPGVQAIFTATPRSDWVNLNKGTP